MALQSLLEMIQGSQGQMVNAGMPSFGGGGDGGDGGSNNPVMGSMGGGTGQPAQPEQNDPMIMLASLQKKHAGDIEKALKSAAELANHKRAVAHFNLKKEWWKLLPLLMAFGGRDAKAGAGMYGMGLMKGVMGRADQQTSDEETRMKNLAGVDQMRAQYSGEDVDQMSKIISTRTAEEDRRYGKFVTERDNIRSLYQKAVAAGNTDLAKDYAKQWRDMEGSPAAKGTTPAAPADDQVEKDVQQPIRYREARIRGSLDKATGVAGRFWVGMAQRASDPAMAANFFRQAASYMEDGNAQKTAFLKRADDLESGKIKTSKQSSDEQKQFDKDHTEQFRMLEKKISVEQSQYSVPGQPDTYYEQHKQALDSAVQDLEDFVNSKPVGVEFKPGASEAIANPTQGQPQQGNPPVTKKSKLIGDIHSAGPMARTGKHDEALSSLKSSVTTIKRIQRDLVGLKGGEQDGFNPSDPMGTKQKAKEAELKAAMDEYKRMRGVAAGYGVKVDEFDKVVNYNGGGGRSGNAPVKPEKKAATPGFSISKWVTGDSRTPAPDRGVAGGGKPVHPATPRPSGASGLKSRIAGWRSKGLNDSEIRNALRKANYNPKQIESLLKG